MESPRFGVPAKIHSGDHFLAPWNSVFSSAATFVKAHKLVYGAQFVSPSRLQTESEYFVNVSRIPRYAGLQLSPVIEVTQHA
jgi:hypothetical protein